MTGMRAASVAVALDYDRFSCDLSTDTVKRNLELTCSRCDTHLCDIEPADDLAVLAALAAEHQCPPPHDKCDHDGGWFPCMDQPRPPGKEEQ